ncbi:copper chaperone PCu(A)C [Corynebacterium pseudopelargi]|uniref:Copper chaperone PCu(A)C n=1 Tax=Corynebacterium pseudopelargi TaxID=2080757 RepID=A0A3G6ITR6_9CORY|nr:copper chaperone PCu(A)C [Corynebacterium pseudopelargi]AZA09141.1 hypothetical protein CPPEL_05105 [Corynebacterium pseudopelargi]
MKVSSIALKSIACMSAAALVLAACSNDEQDSTESSQTSATQSAENTSAENTSTEAASEAKLTVTDPYVKAMEGDKDMTAIFGVLHNDSDAEITITSFSATIDAEKFEMHEVVDGQMREKEGGFSIPAGQSLVLEPGKEHMMVLGVTEPVKAGDKVELTLELADGSTVNVPDVPVRTIGAGEENYGSDADGMKDMGASESASADHEHHH